MWVTLGRERRPSGREASDGFVLVVGVPVLARRNRENMLVEVGVKDSEIESQVITRRLISPGVNIEDERPKTGDPSQSNLLYTYDET